jgi:hypothetical protein
MIPESTGEKGEFFMEKLGKRFETIAPDWKSSFITGIVATLICLCLTVFIPSIFAMLFFGFLTVCSIGMTANAFRLRGCFLAFHANGLCIRTPKLAETSVLREQIEDFCWEAEDVLEESAYSSERHESITINMTWEDEKSEFQEVVWTEKFPAGTISRLRRAIDLADDRQDAYGEESDPEEEYWDE